VQSLHVFRYLYRRDVNGAELLVSIEKNIRVLVVEDDRDTSFTISKLLIRSFSTEVDCAMDIATARELLGSTDYDVVTLDYQLPDGDGISLLEEIRKRGIRARAIVITGHGDERVAARAFQAGAMGYVVKDTGMATTLGDVFRKALADIDLEQAETSPGD
jgi:DNA-binding NtrC family response regulator